MRLRKRFSDGKVSLAYSSFLGYEKGEDGRLRVIESEAKTFRLIFRLFMEGMIPSAIAKYQTHNIPSPTGKSKWGYTTVRKS
jgi:site-specific DNA recombinase